ncbi:hypothetical protein KP509_04G045400 [Ceratopteris richardii]|nr:hypothetical protein KP509_04G045400 [Ceratopteris richardii]
MNATARCVPDLSSHPAPENLNVTRTKSSFHVPKAPHNCGRSRPPANGLEVMELEVLSKHEKSLNFPLFSHTSDAIGKRSNLYSQKSRDLWQSKPGFMGSSMSSLENPVSTTVVSRVPSRAAWSTDIHRPLKVFDSPTMTIGLSPWSSGESMLAADSDIHLSGLPLHPDVTFVNSNELMRVRASVAIEPVNLLSNTSPDAEPSCSILREVVTSSSILIAQERDPFSKPASATSSLTPVALAIITGKRSRAELETKSIVSDSGPEFAFESSEVRRDLNLCWQKSSRHAKSRHV